MEVFYEIYPDLTLEATDTPDAWFEIALHSESEEYRPSDHPKRREAVSVLMGVADQLVERAKSHVPYRLEMPVSYHTLCPNEGSNQPGIALTVSLIFSDAGPYTQCREPGLLTQLRDELALLGIPRRKAILVAVRLPARELLQDACSAHQLFDIVQL